MDENEAIVLLNMCMLLARRLSPLENLTNVRLTWGELTNLRGFSMVLNKSPLPQRPHLLRESGLTELEQTGLIRMLEVIVHREKVGLDAANGQVISHRQRIKAKGKPKLSRPIMLRND